MEWTRIFKKASYSLFLVFIAFTLMVLVGYLSVRGVLKRHLLANSEEALRTAEANLSAGFSQAELLLANSYNMLLRLLSRDASQEALLLYMTDTTNWLRRPEEEGGLAGFYGIYGYIRGEYIDGRGINPGPNFAPRSTPWYRTAETSGREIRYTMPYRDIYTGQMIISVVRNLFGATGNYYGVLVLDIDIGWFNQYIRSLGFASGGYGIVINQDMVVISHPDKTREGQPLEDIGGEYDRLPGQLLSREHISAERIRDSAGERTIVFVRRMFNGWYIAQVTPEQNYYRDIYQTAINLSVLGFILMSLLCMVMIRIYANQLRSDEVSKYKTAFLAQMSHEIRTPMNAIIGMSELAQRIENPAKLAEYIGGIKQAGHNLLSIINDILDVSKIESGLLQIHPAPYLFSSILNDVINVMRIRVAEKSIFFIANVDPDIPNNLLGDEARIRQILLNLLSNAAKYTHKGHMALTVRYTPMRYKRILLTLEVSDTGIGIKKEDIPQLFSNFVRLDMEKNRGVEGTGLGLVITKNLCDAMGGSIGVSSEYGKGSVFTATIPQSFIESDGLAAVENPETKGVLCFSEQPLYTQSIVNTLNSLKVPVKAAGTRDEFFRELESGVYPFAFVPDTIVGEAAERIQNKVLPVKLVLLAKSGEMTSYQNIPMMVMPAYVVPIANVLNNRAVFERRKRPQVRFIAPEARILVVDDIATNLKVAEGLLAFYQTQVETCLDGRQAVELVRNRNYDIVFMDHMMPGMDGIEAAAAIRALEGERFRNLPIIALTANAIAGMKEMFLANGFNDYLAKPIELSKLDDIMGIWIPRKKQVHTEAASPYGQSAPEAGDSDAANAGDIVIKGIDVQQGIAMTGGSQKAYFEILGLYCKDVDKRLDMLGDFLVRVSGKVGETAEEEADFSGFTTQVHALKSASATIGAAKIAKTAARLEEAGKNGDRKTIAELLGGFNAELAALVRGIRSVQGADSGASPPRSEADPGAAPANTPAAGTAGKPAANPETLAALTRLREALAAEDIRRVDAILNTLHNNGQNPELTVSLNDVSDNVLMSEFQKAITIVDELLKTG